MFKKCLIFLFILTISYLCPICSSAQSDTKGGPVKDICVCNCTGINGLGVDFPIYSDNKCTDESHDFENISDEKQCKKKNGQECRGYAASLTTTCGDRTGTLNNCHIVSAPD